MNLPRNLQAGLISLILVIVIGTLGFMMVGDLNLSDAAYLTIVTITTLGFAFLAEPLDGKEQLWLVIVLIAGMGAAIYTFTAFVEYGFETVIGSDYRRLRRMRREVRIITDHVIVCGYGRVGSMAAARLTAGGVPVVVIESRPLPLQEAIDAGLPVVEGDATRDEVLLEAGLARARSIIASVEGSSDNLVITLSAKAIRSDISVTARAIDAETEKKLTLAGADAVVTPELVGGARMAALATQPGLAEFIETVVHDSANEFRIKRFIVGDRSEVVGKSLTELHLRRDSGAMVIGVTGEGEPMRINPDPAQPFRAGDAVYGIGTEVQLDRLEHILEAG
ncbi:MAG: NAD-binding protein [Acidimicrobiia bacterium]|nr:NAD-binding protein [Acidimicrobiia bacterium]